MKILLTLNKTYRGIPDAGYWYTYLPLKELGHEVYWYDTVDPEEKDYNKIIEKFKPDLIFCCMTNNSDIAPHEPWDEIIQETQSGRTKTFNWFCDDTWRFETFSRETCECFTVCTTPEPSYIEKYKSIGYNNILLGGWHANSTFYQVKPFVEKEINISFIGAPNPIRQGFFDRTTVPIEQLSGISQQELFVAHCNTQIGLNLSFNMNDVEGKTQMKQRMFEIPAGAGLLLTEYHEGIEEFFEIDKEIITFKAIEEFDDKAQFLLKHPQVVKSLSAAGYVRFLAEHESKVRLQTLLHQIGGL
ncbi:hypothetical protein CMI47_14750 [Candidatus Pacearchaeota archaeon]|nr:hypothetical protein [Candidatus Pacearchaeota archaeon]|tara:strand:+ start:2254 stop:3156 length:903 start_codon:yes stop_codon:yes gene_type:complete